jgi:hypothetical protein
MEIIPRAFARPSSLARPNTQAMHTSFREADHLLVNKKNSSSSMRAKPINARIFEALQKFIIPPEDDDIDLAKIFKLVKPCCVNCFISQKPIACGEYCVRKIIPEDNIVIFQELDGDATIVAQVMDMKCMYWSLGNESSELQKEATRIDGKTARLHPGNLWNVLMCSHNVSMEKVIDMSMLHRMNCQDASASDTDSPISLCMRTLKVTPPALVQYMIHKDINEKRRRWGRDSFLRFCS